MYTVASPDPSPLTRGTRGIYHYLYTEMRILVPAKNSFYTILNKILAIWLVPRRAQNPYWCTAVRSDVYGNCLNLINNGSSCSVLFLSTPGLFPALRKTLEYSTASRALKFFCVLETILLCSKTVLSTLNHCLFETDLSDFCSERQLE